MFYLIMALAFNPVTHHTTWAVSEQSFTTSEQCDAFATSQTGQDYLKANGAQAYTCDTLKDVK